ncbi:MAG: 3-dehydroquinate synthase [Verrucomicrobiales bacterium]|nr:3-dehydroquinate synthase [Verrucomicrobiales bacterium]
MIRTKLSLAHDEYEVLVGTDLIDRAGELIAEAGHFGNRAALVTDSNVDGLYAAPIGESLEKSGIEVVKIVVQAGEPSKSMECVTDICRQMLQAGLDRKSFLVALGGGVIGDLAGFAAAIFQRGIPCVQIPTTVVSLVDSSVGGKTGVNTPEGKNLVGSFHQPKLVIADVSTLQSLPDRGYFEGYAEIIKHAAIRDARLLEIIEKMDPENRENLAEMIARNVGIKARVVEEDERETTGTRALLNFGHTIGHGIEAAGGYGKYFHGEAISLGLAAASRLSVKKSGLAESDADRIIAALKQFHLPTVLDAEVKTVTILEKMTRDKKFEDGKIRFVLLREIGDAFVSDEVSLSDIEAEIEALRG